MPVEHSPAAPRKNPPGQDGDKQDVKQDNEKEDKKNDDKKKDDKVEDKKDEGDSNEEEEEDLTEDDIKNFRINDLRIALRFRGLSTKGKKVELAERLMAAIDEEKRKREEENDDEVDPEVADIEKQINLLKKKRDGLLQKKKPVTSPANTEDAKAGLDADILRKLKDMKKDPKDDESAASHISFNIFKIIYL